MTHRKEKHFNAVFDSQAVFRKLMDAMARPGRIYILDKISFEYTPTGLNPFVLSVFKTICDNNVLIGGAGCNEDWLEYLRINTMTLLAAVEEADYLLFNGAMFIEGFGNIKTGNLEFPEHGGTAVLLVENLSDKNGTRANPGSLTLRMKGPGIKNATIIKVTGLNIKYIETSNNLKKFYPMGIDLILIDNSGKIAAIPRSTKLEVITWDI